MGLYGNLAVDCYNLSLENSTVPHRGRSADIISQLFLEAEWAIDSEAMRARGIIALVKSN